MRRHARPPETSIDISEQSGVRSLHFGSDWVQGAMRIARPFALELEYTREMMTGLLFRDPAAWPRRALLVGLGAGSLPKFIYRHLPDCQSTVVEINPQIEFVARQFFKLPEDPRRLRILIQDGADFMGSGDSEFDAIFVDGFDPDGQAGVLDTVPFYQACRARLAVTGLLVVNLLGRDRGFKTSVAHLQEAFDHRVLTLPPSSSGNVIAFARGDQSVSVDLDTLRARADVLKETTGLDLFPTIARLQLQHPTPLGVVNF